MLPAATEISGHCLQDVKGALLVNHERQMVDDGRQNAHVPVADDRLKTRRLWLEVLEE